MKANKQTLDLSLSLDKNPFKIMTEEEVLIQRFKLKACILDTGLGVSALTPEFEVKFSLKDENDMVLLKESIDTYLPLSFYNSETSEIEYKHMSNILSNEDMLKSMEALFNLIKNKQEKGKNVQLDMEVTDKDTGISLFSDHLDKAKFLKSILNANQKNLVKENLNVALKSAATIGVLFVMFNYNIIEANTIDHLKTAWDSTFGVAGDYVVSAVDSFVKTNTNGANTNLISSALSTVTETFKTIKENGPVSMIGLMLGIPTYGALKDIYKSFFETKEKKEKVDVLFGVEFEYKEKTIDTYKPLFNI